MDKFERSNLFRMMIFLGVIWGIFVFLTPLNAQVAVQLPAQNAAQSVALSYSGNGGYTLVERTNLRRYVNGKYIGLTSREVRSFISPSAQPAKLSQKAAASFGEGTWYDGSFYVMEETMRNGASVGPSVVPNSASGSASGVANFKANIHDSISSEFHISPDGKMAMATDNGYPSFRSFPAFPAKKVIAGESWQAEAERAVDPLNKGIVTRMPMYVQYTFADEEVYRKENVYRIKAIWQTNYNDRVRDPKGDSTLTKAAGGHKADILIRKSTGEMTLAIDNVDEQFVYSDGGVVQFKGTITLFTELPPAIEHEKIIQSLNRIAMVTPETKAASAVQNGNSDAVTTSAGTAGIMLGHGVISDPEKNNMIVEKTPAGLRLSMRDIKFAPDSADVSADEKNRLDEITEVLKLAPKSQFLVEGHTASVGKPDGEQKLSEQRAHHIAEELAERGVRAEAFICCGWGGNKPVASNDTDAGRAQNRRVEITILE
jgi:outer membrane protein OmpA-like peptidoglycan-associated protein